MKKLSLSLIIVAFLLCFGAAPAYARASQKYLNATNAYGRFEKKRLNKNRHTLLCDFTGDGVPELVTYKYAGVRYQVDFYTYKNHKITKLNRNKIYGVADVGYRIGTKKIYIMQTNSAFDFWIQECKIIKNRLVNSNCYRSLTNCNTNKTRYTKNEKKITRRQFNKYMNQIEWIIPRE